MLSGLAGRVNRVVAGEARGDDGRMIHRRPNPSEHRVTLVARLGRGNVVGGLAGGEHRVVAIRAQPHPLRVIKRQRRLPLRGRFVVACLAQVAGVEALTVLPGFAADVEIRARVAAHAIRGDGCVVHRRRLPRRRGVAHATVLRGRDVVLALAARQRAVVTVRTQLGGLRVIEGQRRLPLLRKLVMARLAGVAGVETDLVFPGFAAGVGAVVTTNAVVHDVGVIDRRGQPRGRAVAQPTVLGRWNVIRLLARGDHTVMARGAARHAEIRLRVIHFDVGFAPGGKTRPRA